MARIGSTVSAPVKQVIGFEVHEKYGLGIGPEGTRFNFTGFQAKEVKWGHLFATDKDGDSILMNVVRYLMETHSDPRSIMEGIERFIKEWQDDKPK